MQSNPSSFVTVRVWHILVAAAIPIAIWFVLLSIHGSSAAFAPGIRKLLKAALFMASCWIYGNAILLRFSVLKGPPRFLIRLTTGLMAIYYAMFVLGILHAYHPLLLFGLYYAPIVVAIPWFVRRTKFETLRSVQFQLDKWQLSVAILALMILFYCFLISLTPVIHYDALTNHLAIPAEYLSRGGIERIPYNLHANLPPASHLIYVLLIGGAGGDTVQLFHFVVAGCIALAFLSVAGESGGMGWLIGWMLFVLIPQVSALFSLTDIDYLVTFICFACLTLYGPVRDSGGRSCAVLLAAHLAFLFSLKYQSAIFIGSILVLLAFHLCRAKQSLFRYARLLMVAFVFTLPFLIKNYLFTGDPVFPFLGDLFPITSPTPQEVQGFIAANSHLAGSMDWRIYFRTLWLCFTKLPEAGPLPALTLFAALFFAGIKNRQKRALALFSVVPILMHCFLTANVVNLMRWIQYSWAAICLLAGLGVNRKPLRAAFILGCLAASFYVAFIFNLRLTRSFPLGIGMISEQEYMSFYIPSFALRQKMMALPPRILFIGDTRGYYNAENSVIPSAYNHLYISRYFEDAENHQQLRRNLQKDGIRYLYLNAVEIRKHLSNGRYRWLEGKKMLLLQQLVAQARVIARDRDSVVVQL